MTAFKIVLVPVLIGLASLAGRRWGPAVGGWLGGFPWVSGPIALYLTLEHGPRFGAEAAKGVMLGLVSTALYCVVYSRLSRRAGWPLSLLAGWAGFAVGTVVLNGLHVGPGVAYAGVLAVLTAVLVSWPGSPPKVATAPMPMWDLPLRMAAAAALVVVITSSATTLGPALSGLLAPFPVYSSVLAAFTHHFEDAGAAGRLLRGLVVGLFTFATFFFVVAMGLGRWGVWPVFAVALGVALFMHGGSYYLLERK